MSTWAGVRKGDAVELRGKVWVVQKIKVKGKRAKVVVARNGQTAEAELKAKDPVKVVQVPAAKAATKLHDSSGAQQRWAKKSESIPAQDARETIGRGNTSIVEPPVKSFDNPWDTPADRIERKLDSLLEAKLVAATDDVEAGYYVPPQDITTIATHLVLFHAQDHDEAMAWKTMSFEDMLELHRDQHDAALKGMSLPINHWHTETRPTPPA